MNNCKLRRKTRNDLLGMLQPEFKKVSVTVYQIHSWKKKKKGFQNGKIRILVKTIFLALLHQQVQVESHKSY